MKHLDLFSGIGGFALAAEMVWDDVEHVFCDNEPFAQAVLKKHWPNAKIYGDIRRLTTDTYHDGFHGAEDTESCRTGKDNNKEGEKELCKSEGGDTLRAPFDLITGGFPCQPFSQAGRRRGTEDDRYLWPEMLRVIREFNPRWVVAENVGGLITWSEGLVFEQVHSDLEAAGYEVQSFVIPAAAKNAPHRRDRVWIVAHCIGIRTNEEYSKKKYRKNEGIRFISKDNIDASYAERKGHEGQEHKARPRTRHHRGPQSTGWHENWAEVASRLCRVDDGIPPGLDKNSRLKALGNAIVPQVAAEIFKAIKASDDLSPPILARIDNML